MSSLMKKAQPSAHLARIPDGFILVMNQDICILLVVSSKGVTAFFQKN